MVSYLSDQGRKICMKGRFSACETDAIEPPFKTSEASENLLEWNCKVVLGMKGKGVIMAVRAAEVAIGEEKDRTDFPRPIHKGSLQKSLDLNAHFCSSTGRGWHKAGKRFRFRKGLRTDIPSPLEGSEPLLSNR